ncbi:OsmC family protein [Virgibacillus byunsanensis]|uniref:OsmC family protein n=1 Tax=Virgibacillus byunsanensis TaxID=570945 RepID=A0ABW3LQK7_9BACI
MEFHLKENGLRTEFDFGELDISGNEEYGYRPFQLMVASIVGCSGSVFRKILEKQRTKVSDMTITAKVKRNPEEANRIEEIRLHYIIKGFHLDPERLYKNLEVARRNCSMVRSVEESIKIIETLERVELSR